MSWLTNEQRRLGLLLLVEGTPGGPVVAARTWDSETESHGFLTLEMRVEYDGFIQVGGHLVIKRAKHYEIARWIQPEDSLADELAGWNVVTDQRTHLIATIRKTNLSELFCDFQLIKEAVYPSMHVVDRVTARIPTPALWCVLREVARDNASTLDPEQATQHPPYRQYLIGTEDNQVTGIKTGNIAWVEKDWPPLPHGFHLMRVANDGQSFANIPTPNLNPRWIY
jgi:hypothetical protein